MTWIDFIYFKIITETSENRTSLDNYDINYFLSIYEGLTLKEYISSLYMRDTEIKRKEAETAATAKKLMGV